MRFLILIGHDEKGGEKLSEEQHHGLFTAYQKYEQELKKAGVLLGGDPLLPSATAVRISAEGGKRKILDGPFTESKEIIGGYLILDVKSRDEALEWASRCPAATLGGWSYVEVREIQELPR
ncbi:MAG: PhnB protein [Polyangiaceae bacterium]|nr:PhnB protein [Polyangiaceae bacterium]